MIDYIADTTAIEELMEAIAENDFFLGEPITAAVVVCGAVIAAGVYLVNRA